MPRMSSDQAARPGSVARRIGGFGPPHPSEGAPSTTVASNSLSTDPAVARDRLGETEFTPSPAESGGPGRVPSGAAPARGGGPGEWVELRIGGMTCASCSNRVARKLNKLAGVSASVNYATEKASVSFQAPVTVEALVAEVVKAGYTAEPAPPPPAEVSGTATGGTEVGGSAAEPGAKPGGRGAAAQAAVQAAAYTRLVVCAVLAAPVVGLAMIPAAQFVNWQWLSLTLAAPVVVWGALPLHRVAWANARRGAATMDTLVSVGVLAAFGWSVFALFWGRAGVAGLREHVGWMIQRGGGSSQIYLEVASGVTVFILAGRYLESRAKRDAGAALRALFDLAAPDVAVLRPEGAAESETRIPTGALVVGDRFVVRPGERIAADGVVERGVSAVDSSMLTGESVPHEVVPGNVVAGGCVNVGGQLVVRATRLGADTLLARITRLVETAQTGKAAVQRLADQVAAVFVPVVIVLAGLTFAGWLLAGASVTEALQTGVAVLIIACPCALGLATPTALLVGTGRGAQLGILIKGPEVLESTRQVDTVLLDKTGTLTTGQMRLCAVLPATGQDPERLLRLSGALEDASEHPIARAIARAARQRHANLPAVSGFRGGGGLGVTGQVEGHCVAVGRPEFLVSSGMTLPDEVAETLTSAAVSVGSAVCVGWDRRVRGVLVVADTVKPTSAEAVRRLHALGLTPILLTGDNAATARQVAAATGISTVIAEVLPEDKVAVVRGLQAEGHVVAMVGDGVNDAAALATADLGLAMGTGTDAAIEAADLTLVRGDPAMIADAITLSRRTLAVIKTNLFWAFAYNIVAIPLAATGMLNPMIAGATMALSSLFVVSNSLRLRRFRPSDSTDDNPPQDGTEGIEPDRSSPTTTWRGGPTPSRGRHRHGSR